MADEINPMYDPRCNHDLPIPGPGCNRDMWTCRYPECTYPEAAPRRLRTQAERDTDGTAWRATAASRPGYATYPQSAPGSPCWWQRHGDVPPSRPKPEARPWTGPDPMVTGRVGPVPSDVMAALDQAQQILAELPPPITCLRMHPAAHRLMAARAAALPPHMGAPPPGLLGLPVIEDTELPYGAWHLLDADGQVVKRGQFRQPPPADKSWIEMTCPPRRRWWHRYTRRNP